MIRNPTILTFLSGHCSYVRRSYWHTCEPDCSHVQPCFLRLTFPPKSFTCSQCGWREVPSDPLRLCQLLWLSEELPAHAGGAGLQPGDVRLSIWQAELQPYVPQLASLRSVSCLWQVGGNLRGVGIRHPCGTWGIRLNLGTSESYGSEKKTQVKVI